ncbi:hypothetical protein SAMN02910432_01012 [Ligilactobacillus ruminis DSM 20403 = NBRC 102161]|uniref:HTH cro/C1-type domain-containing protein n=1 Tax=Ligilactobacillus ruminis DSM 20403 = NBRC 102161 TaxID=1423798 RepID=A0A1I2R4I3_9LACO|nr:hypothetical protein SAMN02910432_01012 [Ligilactobacillus ruminis DSM 20403 = NBRC 102161]
MPTWRKKSSQNTATFPSTTFQKSKEKKQNVSIEKLVDICNALNISVEEILDSKHNLSIKNLPPNAIELITYLRDSDNSNIDEICEQLLLMKEMEK